jgi:predicted esterase
MAARHPRRTAEGITFVDLVLPGTGSASTAAGTPAPEDPPVVVLTLHGRGDRPHVPSESFYGLPGPVRYLAPQAPTELGRGFTWLPERIAHGDPDRLSRAIADAVDRLRLALETLPEPVRSGGPERLLVTGFSQGGILTLGLALRHPSLVAVALPTAAMLPSPFVDEALARARPTAPPPIRGLHGEADPEVPVAPALELYRRLGAAGWDAQLETFPRVAHETSPEMHRRKGQWLRAAARDPRGADP